jgi:hypothetical protein
MPFADTTSPVRFQNKKVQFLPLIGGNYTIRILDSEALCLYTHYINKVTVECLGEECPICSNNQRLIMENPKDFRNVQGYAPRTRRYLVNVLDKTMVKKCPKCGLDNYDISATGNSCIGCSEMIISVVPEPSNTVKILAKGVQVFDQLNSIDLSILNDKGEPLGLTNYDLVLRVTGTGNKKIVTPIPMSSNVELVDPNLEKYELAKITIKLTPEEMLDLQRGVSLRDLFAARRANAGVDPVMEELQSEVSDAVKKLFTQ